MLENIESLLPIVRRGEMLQALILGFEDESVQEMKRLLGTLQVASPAQVIAQVRKINPGTYVGAGKLEEVKAEVERTQAGVVIIDKDLSPNQLRNVEKVLGKPVVDRPGVIIEIFSRHARTKESKTQIELAKLQYLLPRLRHFWTHFERQRGGIGQKGMGETQIEVDRRLVKDRMSLLRKRLKEIEGERKIQRAGRKDVLKVAIVGYTNAGKSTLLNALTHSQVLAEDKLFATLDASVRTLDPHAHPPIVAIDTVGFISNLPTSLIASFRSTLEELHEADLLVHVVDASSPGARDQIKVTEEVIEELGAGEKPRLIVLNKVDLVPAGPQRVELKVLSPGALQVSALDPEQVAKLRDQIVAHFRGKLALFEIVVPYSQSKLESQLYAHGAVETKRHMEKGTFYRVRMDEGWAKKLGLEKFKP
jgi:GTP-binding protein HflX